MARSRLPLAAAVLIALSGCATPLAPNPQVDLTGDWRVTAVDGVATPVRTGTFNFRYAPPSGSAQFGCNWGSGSASTENGWLVAGDWIITAAGCPDDRARFERQGFEILSAPLAIEPASLDRIRLRNERGSIILQRESVPQLAGTRWRIFAINGVPPPGGGTISFTPTSYQANFGCNDARGEYRQESNRLRSLGVSYSEKGCLLVAPSGLSVMTFEEWGTKLLQAGDLTVSVAGPRRVQLDSSRGAILLERLP